MEKKSPGPRKFLHVVVGTPDVENCPICRAHHDLAMGPTEIGPNGPVFVQEVTLVQILRCSCPLCVQARRDGV